MVVVGGQRQLFVIFAVNVQKGRGNATGEVVGHLIPLHNQKGEDGVQVRTLASEKRGVRIFGCTHRPESSLAEGLGMTCVFARIAPPSDQKILSILRVR